MKNLTVSIQITVLFLNILNTTLCFWEEFTLPESKGNRLIPHKLKVLRVAQNKHFGGNL